MRTFSAEECTNEELSRGADQRILVKDRRSQQTIADLKPIGNSFFERDLDETSVAEVYAQAQGADCCGDLNDLTLFQDIEWYRDSKLAWAGYTNLLRWDSGQVFIQARDFTGYWETKLAPTLDITGEDATDIVERLHLESTKEDPVTNFKLVTKKTGELLDFQSYSGENRPVKDLINELADYVIDYTALGRNILVGPNELFPELPFFLKDEDFVTPPMVEARGTQYGFCTRVHAVNDQGLKATATASQKVLAIYGLIEVVVPFEHIRSLDDLQKAAETHLAIFSNPYYLNSASSTTSELKPGASIDFQSLVPGMRIMVESTSSCKKLRTKMRILKIRNEASGGVTVSFEPVGSTI